MNTKENEIIGELSKKYNKKEKVIQIMYEKSKEVKYSIEEFEKILKQFYLSKTCPK